VVRDRFLSFQELLDFSGFWPTEETQEGVGWGGGGGGVTCTSLAWALSHLFGDVNGFVHGFPVAIGPGHKLLQTAGKVVLRPLGRRHVPFGGPVLDGGGAVQEGQLPQAGPDGLAVKLHPADIPTSRCERFPVSTATCEQVDDLKDRLSQLFREEGHIGCLGYLNCGSQDFKVVPGQYLPLFRFSQATKPREMLLWRQRQFAHVNPGRFRFTVCFRCRVGLP